MELWVYSGYGGATIVCGGDGWDRADRHEDLLLLFYRKDIIYLRPTYLNCDNKL